MNIDLEDPKFKKEVMDVLESLVDYVEFSHKEGSTRIVFETGAVTQVYRELLAVLENFELVE